MNISQTSIKIGECSRKEKLLRYITNDAVAVTSRDNKQMVPTDGHTDEQLVLSDNVSTLVHGGRL